MPGEGKYKGDPNDGRTHRALAAFNSVALLLGAVILEPLLRLFGRQGFFAVSHNDYGVTLKIDISRRAFKKRKN